jgi:hypothetical protein
MSCWHASMLALGVVFASYIHPKSLPLNQYALVPEAKNTKQLHSVDILLA